MFTKIDLAIDWDIKPSRYPINAKSINIFTFDPRVGFEHILATWREINDEFLDEGNYSILMYARSIRKVSDD